MNIIQRINRKIFYLRTGRFVRKQSIKLIELIRSEHSNNRIYLFCAPIHSNLGDQAQLMCWLRLFAEWYPQHEVVCVPDRYRDHYYTLREIRNTIKHGDIVFIHSGYLIFDPHPELHFILDVVRAFYDYPITILPQTVNLKGDWYRQVVAHQFNAHMNLTLFCRDEVSYKNAEALFPNVKLKLLPDVVTSLIGDKEFYYNHTKRNGVMLCVRNDGEKLYTEEQINNLKKRFKGIKVAQSDTTIIAPIWKWEKDREFLIRKMIEFFSHYQVVITDRYHGTIFSQIANTPVIVLSSTDHKLSSGVRWFPKDVFGNMIQYAANLEEAYVLALDIVSSKTYHFNPSYFKTNFYQKPF